MLGVYLTAAELTALGFIVSPTSRSAIGADLLVTDQFCRKAWSVQVKTNRKAAGFWLLNPHVAQIRSDRHIYIFINMKAKMRPEFFVVPSLDVVRLREVQKSTTGAVWHVIKKAHIEDFREGWDKVFGASHEPR